jgi:hypothetical protein
MGIGQITLRQVLIDGCPAQATASLGGVGLALAGTYRRSVMTALRAFLSRDAAELP